MICSAFYSPRQSVLIDVDTQSHFFDHRSPICIQNHRRVLTSIEKVVAWARQHHLPMVSTLQVHTSHACLSRTATPCRLSLRKPTCTLCPNRLSLTASDSLDWSNRAWQDYDQIMIQKRSFDPFDEPRADRILTNLDADEFILIGTPVEGAVKATALGLLLRQKQVTIVTDAVGQLNTYLAHTAWEHLHSKNIRFVNTRRLVKTSPRVPAIAVH
jgi:nicotinamidase-related amidase